MTDRMASKGIKRRAEQEGSRVTLVRVTPKVDKRET
jgi:hypothetical protein